MFRVILVFLLFTQYAAAADVYKTIDENGNVIYTDKPTSDKSEKIDIGEPIVVPGIIPSPRPRKANNSSPPPPTNYSVSITQPAPETHLNPGEFTLAIQVSTDPAVHELHQLVILDNGTQLPGPVIEYITPGSHRLQAQVLDQRGKVIGSSTPVLVYAHRANLNNRPPPPPGSPTTPPKKPQPKK